MGNAIPCLSAFFPNEVLICVSSSAYCHFWEWWGTFLWFICTASAIGYGKISSILQLIEGEWDSKCEQQIWQETEKDSEKCKREKEKQSLKYR